MTTFSNLSIIFQAACAAGLVIVYALVCWCTGRLLIGRNALHQDVAGSFALGHASVAIALQLMTVGGVLYWYVVAPMFGAVVVFSLLLVPLRFRKPEAGDFLPETRLSKLLAGAVALLLVGLLAASFSLPGTDALAYYMAQPKLMAATGSYTLLTAYETFGVLPAVAEMPYAAMYAFGGDPLGFVAAKFSMWPVLLTILVLLWRCARVVGASIDAAWLFVALAITSSAITLVAWDGKTDLIGLMYLIAAILWMPGIHSSSLVRRDVFLFGFMAACAVMAKFSYALILPFVLGIPLVCLWWKKPKYLLQVLMLAGSGVLLAFASGWWLKNAFLFGDPFAPLLRLNEATPKFDLEQVWFNAEYTRWIVQTYPFAVTFGKYPMQHGGISPMWLMLIPALWMKPWRSEGGRKALYLAAGSFAGLCAWILFRPSVIAPRYFLPALLLPCLILVMGFQLWRDRKPMLARATLVAILLLLAFHLQSTRLAFLYFTAPLVGSLKGNVSASPVFSRMQRLEADQRQNVKVLLLSYSSEMLPSRILTSFFTVGSLRKDETVFEFALREKVDYIVYDPITHKRADMENAAPLGLSVEKITFAADTYYLYALTRPFEVK